MLDPPPRESNRDLRLEHSAFFRQQILIDDRSGDARGLDFECERAALAERAQKHITTVDDFLGGSVVIHLGIGFGPRFGERAQFGIGNDRHQDEMAARKAQRPFDNVRHGGGFGQIGEPDHEATAFLEMEKRLCCACVIGFEFFVANLRETFDERRDVAGTAASGKTLLNATSVSEKRDAVAGVKRDLRERKRGADGVVEFCEAARAGAQKTARVEDEPDGLATLELMRFRD